MAENSGNSGGYKIPNSSTGKVMAPNAILKNQGTPSKTVGGDLRSK